MKNFKHFFGLLAVITFIFANVSKGQLLLTDDFTGLNIGPLGGQSSWTQSGTGPSVAVANTTPLTYSGYNGGGAEYVNMPTATSSSSKCYKSLISAPTQGTNTFYFSFLLRLTATSASSVGYFITLGNPTTGTTYFARLFAKTSGAGFNLGISKLSNTPVYGSSVFNLNQTYLIVVKYDFLAGTTTDDQMYLYVNPSLTSEPSTSSAESSILTAAALADGNPGTIGNFLWHNRGLTNPSGAFDGIRVSYGANSASAWANLNISTSTANVSTSGTLTQFSTEVGTPSTSQNYTVSGSNLTADVIVTPPANFEISLNNSTWVTSTSNIPLTPTSGTLGNTLIYVRYNPGASGTHTGNVTNTSTGATQQDVAVSGFANTNYYLAVGGKPTDVTNWGDIPDGTGTNPPDFITTNQTFNLSNNAYVSLDAAWIVSGTSSKIVVKNGVNFNIPSSFAVTGTVDINNGAVLTVDNAILPTFGAIGLSSTIVYNQSGTFSIPNTFTYGNLTLKNGTKTFAGNTTTINGGLVFDGVIIDAPAASPFATISLAGDLTYLNTVTPPVDGSSITLICTKSGTQTITGNGNIARFFRVQTSGTGTNVVLSNTGGSTKLRLGNASSGGLSLGTGTNLTLNSNTVEFSLNDGTPSKALFIGTGTLSCDGTSSLILNNNNTTAASLGTIYFAAGANSLLNFTINETNTQPLAYFSLGSDVNVLGTLTLTSGDTRLGANTLTIGPSGSITGTYSSSNMLVTDGAGKLTINNISTTETTFPIGTATSYNPAFITNSGTTVNFGAKVSSILSNPPADPTKVVPREWDIIPSAVGSNCTIKLLVNASDYSVTGTLFNPAGSVVLGHYVDGIWTEINATISGTGPYTIQADNVSGFSPFAVGNQGALPVNLASLNSSVIGRDISLKWITSAEQNNSGFEVQRASVDRSGVTGDYSKVTFVNGSGTTSEQKSYSYTDRNLNTGKYKYRLKQVDYNGNFEYFSLNSVIEIGVPNKFDMSQNYPNPFNPVTKINFDLPADSKVNLLIYDVTGREVAKLLNNEFRAAGYHTAEFNASNFASGVYFYSFSTETFRITKRMMLIK